MVKKIIPREKEVLEKKERPIIDNEIPSVKKGFVRLKKKWEGLLKKDKRKLKKKPETSFLVRMFFSNGTSREFVVSTNNELFTHLILLGLDDRVKMI